MLIKRVVQEIQRNSTDRFIPKQRPGFSYRVKTPATPNIDVATFLEIFKARERETIGSGHDPKQVFEEFLVAGNRKWAMVAESILLLRFHQQLPKYRVVQVSRAHDKPPTAGAHTHCHVSRWDVGCSPTRSYARFVAPAKQHLPDSDNSPDLAAVSG